MGRPLVGRWTRLLVALAVGVLASPPLAAVMVTSPADAQPAEENAAIALQLFNRGLAHIDAGEVEAACEAFRESLRLSPGNGTRYQLASCYERQGKLATAWGLFQRVLVESQRSHNDARVVSVQQRLTALEPQVPRLRVDVTKPAARLDVRRNGDRLGPPQWNSAVPVDPGNYTIEARAAGKRTWQRTINVAPAARVRVAVPPLADAPAVRPTQPAAPQDTGLADMRVAALAVGGVGVVSFAGAIGASVLSINDNRAFDELCPDPKNCNSNEGLALNDEAKSAAHAATALTIIGGGAVITAIVLWVVAPEPGAPRVVVVPQLGAHHLGAQARLRW